jgi:hypothetical protein
VNDLTLTITSFALVAAVAGWHLRRLLIAPPFHLLADEQRTYRNVSLLTIGLMLATAPLAAVHPALWAGLASFIGAAGSRIGARLHLARPLVARLACVPLPDDPDIDDCAYLKCVRTLRGTSLSWHSHAVPDPVAILMTPRTMSRTALRDLPFTLIGGVHESHIPAAVAFLREARECGCLTFVDETDTAADETTARASERGAA